MGNNKHAATRPVVGTALLLIAAGSYFILPALLSLSYEDFAYTLPGLIFFALPALALPFATGRSVQRELCFLAAAVGFLLVIFSGPIVLLTATLYAVAGAVTPDRPGATPSLNE